MSSAILDMQCVLGVKNKYMIKEMSIVDTETWATQHWIFKHANSMQDNKSQKTNKWLERNYHQLAIEYGDIEYEELGKILNSLKFGCIYIKGSEHTLGSEFIIIQPYQDDIITRLYTHVLIMDVLNSRQTNVLNLSIGELTKNIEYRVQSMNNVETKFGMAVACVLQDPAGGGIINVFLPKSVQLSSDEIQRYNQHEADPVNLIFRDPMGSLCSAATVSMKSRGS
ncbi:hypothetical protein AGLY_018298 [Aphis glycines]|uniref:Uncharacterized protein n=1 Tax=Aphis glycines TaxID=307491 RepID=A0A6G0SSI9_APHGL|nr:hypothetical protein AGLY_018298 [Aphis glycines]